MTVQMREYQVQAIEACKAHFKKGTRRGIVHLPTGTGKSVVQNELTKQVFPIEAFRTVFIAGLSRSLNHQAVNGYKRQYPNCERKIEINGRLVPGIGLVMGDEDHPSARIVVASAQTIVPKTLKEPKVFENKPIEATDVYMKDGGIFLSPKSKRKYLISPRFDAILAFGQIHCWVHDEAHHAPADGSMWIIEQLRLIYQFLGLEDLYVVGFTATPIRNDKRAMSNVFEKMFFSRTYKWAQKSGFLCPLPDENVHRVKIVTEYGREDRLQVIDNWDERIVIAYKDLAPGRTAVAFVGPINDMSAVDASKRLSAKFNEMGIASVHVDGLSWVDVDGTVKSNKLRPQLFERIMRGEISVVCNFNVLTEGIDLPRLDCVLLARPVNEGNFTQIIGRVLRNYRDPVTDVVKKDAMIVDFTGKELVITALGAMTGITKDVFAVAHDEDIEDEDDEVLAEYEDGMDLRDIHHAGMVQGVKNIYSLAKLKQKSSGFWYDDHESHMSMPISRVDEGALYIHPPHFGTAEIMSQALEREDLDEKTYELVLHMYEIFSNFTLWHTVKGPEGKHILKHRRPVRIDPAIDNLMAIATEYAEEQEGYDRKIAEKGEKWHKRPVSSKQIYRMKQEGVKLPSMLDGRIITVWEDLLSGEAGQLITHTVAQRAVTGIIERGKTLIMERVK